jgi:hypothetical protein
MAYSISTDNYTKPTPWILKLIADGSLLIAGIVEILPDFIGKEWVVAGSIAFKLITKFITDHPKP